VLADLPDDVGLHGVELRLCLTRGGVGRQTADYGPVEVADERVAIVGRERGRPQDVHARWQRDERAELAGPGEPEVARQHADHRVALVVQRDGLADHRPVAAEPLHPEAVAEQHDRAVPFAVLVLTKQTPGLRLHAEHRQERRGGTADLDARRISAARHRLRGRPHRGDGVESRDAGLPQQVLAGGRRQRGVSPRHCGNHRADDDEPFVMRVGQRPEQDRVDQREDRGVRPDADGDQDDDEQAEPWLAPHHPQSVADILGDRIEGGEAARVAVGLAGLIDAAEPAPRFAARVLAREPLALEVPFEQRQVRLDLGIEAAQAPSPREETSEASRPRSQRHYSHRRACTGSIRMMRRAGR
jgi:hypothetical protein